MRKNTSNKNIQILLQFLTRSFRIEYTSTEDKKLRTAKDVSVTVQSVEPERPRNTEKNYGQTSETLITDRDPNVNYYLCIGEFRNIVKGIRVLGVLFNGGL